MVFAGCMRNAESLAFVVPLQKPHVLQCYTNRDNQAGENLLEGFNILSNFASLLLPPFFFKHTKETKDLFFLLEIGFDFVRIIRIYSVVETPWRESWRLK